MQGISRTGPGEYFIAFFALVSHFTVHYKNDGRRSPEVEGHCSPQSDFILEVTN